MGYLTKGLKNDLKTEYALLSKRDKILFGLLFFIPLLNSAADCTIYYFVDESGGGLHPGIIRGILLVAFILFFGVKRLLKNPVNTIITVFLLYLLILTLFSSNVKYSFTNGYVKWLSGLAMFPIAYYFFRSYDSFVRLVFFMIIGASFVCLNLLYAQFAGKGISAYVDDSFYLGGAGVGITNQLAFVLLAYPVILRSLKKFSLFEKGLIFVVGLLCIIFVIIAMKRASLVSLAFGSIIYFGFTRNKGKVLKYVLLATAILLFASPFYKDNLQKRYEERVKQTQNYEQEGRYQEFFFVIKEFEEGNIWQKLFGKEIFNTGQNFGVKYFNRGRMIHGDISSMFYGSGLVGITMYFWVFILIFLRGISYLRKVRGERNLRELMASFFSMLIAIMIVSATGSGTVGEKCLVFLFLGAISGIIAHMKPLNENTDNGSVPLNISGGRGL